MINKSYGNRVIAREDLEHVTRLIEPCMYQWKSARILVTGATGFFGNWLLETFHHANQALGLGAELVGIGSLAEDFALHCPNLVGLDDVTLIKADIRQLGTELVSQLPDWGQRIDAVIHAAIHVDSATYERQPLSTLETGVLGVWEALELARHAKVRRFLFVSSGAVYGSQPAGTEYLYEDHGAHLDSASHQSAYAEGKRIGETLCAGYLREHGLPVTIARPFAFVGPHLPLNRQFAIGNFMRDALAGGPIIVQSDGTPVRSYLYAADLAVWLWTILGRGALGRPYNVGSDKAVTLREVADVVNAVASPGGSVDIRGTAASGPSSRYVPSTLRARLELGLAETVQLEDAIRRTVDWHRRMQ
jgi:nucleoside-diphosphate-sugar epimerase